MNWSSRSLFACALLALSACSSSSSDTGTFVVLNTAQSVAGTTVVRSSGTLAAFLSDEATLGAGGTDLNGDGDVIDAICVVVNAGTGIETSLNVATLEFEWVGTQLYLIVNESLDQTDWDGDMAMTSQVLLHWTEGMMTPALVATVSPTMTPQITVSGTRLYYHNATTPVGPFASNLFYVDSAAPTTPFPIMTQDATAELTVTLLGIDSGLLFLLLNETVEGRDLNNDLDMTDTAVLALLDGTDAAGVIRNVQLAVPGVGMPFRALPGVAGDWLVGFLVNEADQDATNLNDPLLFAPTWKPVQCVGFEDADTTDNVLHFLNFADWNMNPGLNTPVNTGLVGSDRIVAAGGTDGFLGVLSTESDEGTCDLNGDGDTADRILRYVQAVTPVLPPGAAANLHAVNDMVPGGTMGVAELDSRFVVLVDEAADGEDHDGDVMNDYDLLAWVAPSEANLEVAYVFNHAASGPPVFFGATWMAEQGDRSRLAVAISEEVGGDFNGDLDALDSVPTFPDFIAGPRLNFPGATIAVVPDNAGALITNGITYFRACEPDDDRDWNGDGDTNDIVLLRLFESVGSPTFLSELNDLPRLAVDISNELDPDVASFIAEEPMSGVDFNGDGDMNDRVLRYFRQ